MYKKSFFLFIVLLLFKELQSQNILNYNYNGSNSTNIQMFDYLKSPTTTSKNNYDEFQGTPYFSENYLPAIIYFQTGKPILVENLKLDLYANEVLILNDNNKVFTPVEQVKTIVFIDNKKNKQVQQVFELVNFEDGQNIYVQAINTGKIRLLERTIVSAKSAEYKPLGGNTPARVVKKYIYYIAIDNEIKRLNSLNRESIQDIIPISDKDNSWLKENKSKLKNKEQIAQFLYHLNN